MFYFPSLILLIFIEKPINLSDLVFEDTVKSKLIYGVFFLSSFVTAGASFAKVLKWGKNPVIKNYVSLKFVKMTLLLITRFFIQGIILSAAVKSLMFQYIILKVIGQSNMLRQVFNVYYRGLCIKPETKGWKEFCINQDILSFDTATLYAPLLMISLLYFPSFLYVLYLSLRFFGARQLPLRFLENPVLFIFPVWTSFSFYKVLKKTGTERQAFDTSSQARKQSVASRGDDGLTARDQRRPIQAYRMPHHMKNEQNEVLKEIVVEVVRADNSPDVDEVEPPMVETKHIKNDSEMKLNDEGKLMSGKIYFIKST